MVKLCSINLFFYCKKDQRNKKCFIARRSDPGKSDLDPQPCIQPYVIAILYLQTIFNNNKTNQQNLFAFELKILYNFFSPDIV